MLTDSFQDNDDGFLIRYHFDGKLFNLRGLQAKSTVLTEVLDEFLYVDGIPKNVKTERKCKNLWIEFSSQSKKLSNDQELIQSDPTSCPQNQKGNN